MPYFDDAKGMAAFAQRCVKGGFSICDLLPSDDWPEYPSGICVPVAGGVALCYRYKDRCAVGAVLPDGYARDGVLYDDCRELFLTPGAVVAKANGQFSKVPCVPGQLVWVTSKTLSCFGRAVEVTEEGRVVTLRKFDGELIDAAVDPKARRFCSAVPVGLMQGAAALMMEGVFEGAGHYALSSRATFLEAKVTGWKKTKAGKYLLTGSSLRQTLVEDHVRVKHAMKEGLREPREWLDKEIAQVAAVEVLARGLRGSEAFLRWFKIEWVDGRRATWEHANAFEHYVRWYEKNDKV